MLNFAHNQLDNGKYVVILMFDISKAFDRLDVNYIISKLYALGIRGPILTWIKSYFANRALIVKFDQILSEQNDICLGVPQGSVLGLLFFYYAQMIFLTAYLMEELQCLLMIRQ
nr:unnamed protein product [Callosobruchus chinensis]